MVYLILWEYSWYDWASNMYFLTARKILTLQTYFFFSLHFCILYPWKKPSQQCLKLTIKVSFLSKTSYNKSNQKIVKKYKKKNFNRSIEKNETISSFFQTLWTSPFSGLSVFCGLKRDPTVCILFFSPLVLSQRISFLDNFGIILVLKIYEGIPSADLWPTWTPFFQKKSSWASSIAA